MVWIHILICVHKHRACFGVASLNECNGRDTRNELIPLKCMKSNLKSTGSPLDIYNSDLRALITANTEDLNHGKIPQETIPRTTCIVGGGEGLCLTKHVIGLSDCIHVYIMSVCADSHS